MPAPDYPGCNGPGRNDSGPLAAGGVPLCVFTYDLRGALTIAPHVVVAIPS